MAVAAWSNGSKNRLLDSELRGVAPTPPAGCFVGLFTVAGGQPTPDASDGTEETAAWYSRPNLRAALGPSSLGQTTTTAQINFGTPTGTFGPYRWAVLFSAATGGTRIAVGQLQFDVTTVSGQQLFMAAAGFVARES
jgi:hypothetical protein